jgi:hypothetical protein
VKKRGKQGRATAASGASGTADREQGAKPQAEKPLQPRPRLLALLSVAFALWIGFLVTLYVKTVYPRRPTVPGYDTQGKVDGNSPESRSAPRGE